MRDTQPETQEEKPSPILIISAKEMEKQIGEDEMYRIHSFGGVKPLPKILARWGLAENDNLKKFIIFFPKTHKSEDDKHKIQSMLSGEVTKKDGKEIYTIINTATENEIRRHGNATSLILDLAKKIGADGDEIRGSLSLESKDENKKILNALEAIEDKDKKKIATREILNKLNEKKPQLTKEGIKFEENPSDSDYLPEICKKINESELWERDGFKLLSSFVEKFKINFIFSIGDSTGNLILEPQIQITKEVIDSLENLVKENNSKRSSVQSPRATQASPAPNQGHSP